MLSILLSQLIATLCLSLSMDKHYKLAFNQPKSLRLTRLFTGIGWLMLLLSLIATMGTSYIGAIALVYWLGMLSINIVGVAFLYYVKIRPL